MRWHGYTSICWAGSIAGRRRVSLSGFRRARAGRFSPISACRPAGMPAGRSWPASSGATDPRSRRAPTCARPCHACSRPCPWIRAIASRSTRAASRSRPEAVDLDTIRFERLAADGTPESLERAAMLHRGELLAGLDGCGEEFEAWLLMERRRLEETHHEILRRLLDHYVVCGAIDRAIQVALRLLQPGSAAGVRPWHADAAVHVSGSGRRSVGAVPQLPRHARPGARRRAIHVRRNASVPSC